MRLRVDPVAVVAHGQPHVRRSSRAAVTTIRVPGGVWVSALSIRIRMICATRTGSHCASIRAPGQPQLELRVVLGERRLELARHRPGQLAEVDLLGPQLERAGLEPRQVEQVDRQLAAAARTWSRTCSRKRAAGLGIEVLVLEQLDEPAEREDRRSQLVRGGRDELLARRLELRELALHLVERDRELPELVARSRPGSGARSRRPRPARPRSSRRLTRCASARATR